jgi:hypothetical protein
MKRGGPLKRKTALKAGTKTLARTEFKRKAPMPRGDGQLARQAAPMKARSKTNARPRPKTGEAELCRGQPCYLRLPGLFCSSRESVVPCHSNQSIHGKGKGIKAHDKYTVPGCWACHAELDQGNRFTRAEKFAFWDAAYARWEPVRAALMEEQGNPPELLNISHH